MTKRPRQCNPAQFVAGEMDSAEVVGNRLFKIRFVAGYGAHGKQKLFTRVIGLDYDSYNNWELGKIMCQIGPAITICEWTESDEVLNHLYRGVGHPGPGWAVGVTLDYIYRERFDLMGPGWALRLRAAPDRAGFTPPPSPRPRRGG